MITFIVAAGIAYALVGLKVFTFTAPRVAWQQKPSHRDLPTETNKLDGMMFGIIAGFLWAVVVPGFGLFRAAVSTKWFYLSRLDRDFWDEPAPVENPIAARRRKRTEQKMQEISYCRTRTNDCERALGMPLTVWEDN